MTAKTKTPLDEAIEQYANRRCDEIQKRRDMGLAPYPIRPAIVADCRYIAEWLARSVLQYLNKREENINKDHAGYPEAAAYLQGKLHIIEGVQDQITELTGVK